MLMLRKVLARDGYGLKLAVLLTGLVLAFGGGAWGADWDGGKIITDTVTVTDKTTADGDVVVNSGELKIKSGGSVELNGVGNDFIINDGAVTVQGAYGGIRNYDAPGSPDQSNFRMDGGTLTVGGTDPALIEFGHVNFSGGDTTISAAKRSNNTATDGTDDGSWHFGSVVYGRTVTVGGDSDITLGDNGGLGTYLPTAKSVDPSASKHSIDINGGKITMSGATDKESYLWANAALGTADLAESTDNNRHGVINMNNGEVLVTGAGAIVTREFNMNGGDVTVNSGGKLTFGGIASTTLNSGSVNIDMENKSIIDAMKLNDKSMDPDDVIKEWGHVNINGGKITNDGVIDFVTGNMTLNATGGTHDGNMYIQNTIEATPTAGTYSKNLNVSGGTFTVDGNLEAANSGLRNTGGTLDVKGTTTISGDTNLGGINRFRSASTVSSNLTMAANSTLWLGKTMTLSGNLKLASSTKLIWDGTDCYVISNNNASGITFSDSTTLDAYLARQTVSNLIESTVFDWDNGGVFATVNNNPNPVGAMTNILNQTGTGHMAAGLSPSVAGTWAGIMTRYKDKLPENAPGVMSILNNLNTNTSSGEAQSIVSTLAGFDSAKSLDISMATANSITGRINSRVADNNLARAQSSGSGFSSRGAFAAPRYGHNVNAFANRFWMGGFGLWEDADKRGFDNGYKYQSGGIIAGYDRVIGDFTAGASYAYTQGDYEDKNALDSNSEIASYALTLYGTYNHATGLFATGMFGYTYSDYDLDNLVTRAGDWDKSSFHANTFTLGGNIGYDIRPTETFSITPSLGLYYYTSASNTFNTSIRHNMRVEQDSFEMPIDVSVNYDIPAGGDSVVRLTANGGYSHDFSWDGGDLDGFGYNGVAGSRISGIKGREVARHTWNVGAGAKYTSGALDVGVKYDYYTKSDYDAHRVMGTVGMSF